MSRCVVQLHNKEHLKSEGRSPKVRPVSSLWSSDLKEKLRLRRIKHRLWDRFSSNSDLSGVDVRPLFWATPRFWTSRRCSRSLGATP